MTRRKKQLFCMVMQGFTILELLIVVSIIAILGAVAGPAVVKYYHECCLNAAMMDIVGMVREAKMRALGDKSYAVTFSTAVGTVALVSGKGADGNWNSDDDTVVRSFGLKDKGGGVRFGYGSYGPIGDLAEAPDGVTFGNNTLVCNEALSGSAGTVYLISSSGAAMAIIVNSTDSGYTLWRWSAAGWVKK